ncbi:MAG: hypothetical protein KH404_04845 [Bifidobacterium pseudolongum]|nr:hypothetical protein [Bifidobacterium pseudolongum]
MSADPLLRVHREPDEASARTWSAIHPGVLTVWADGETAGSYLNGTRCAIPFRAHQWVQGLINGRKIWTPPPDLLTWWEGEPNNSVSALAIRVPYTGGGRMTYTHVHNQCGSPYITVKAPYAWNVTASQRDDGLWQYEVKDKTGYVRGTVGGLPRASPPIEGDVLVLVYDSADPVKLVGANSGASYCMRGCEWVCGGTISPTIGWNACRVVDTAFTNHEFVIHVDAEPVTLLAYAVYSATDWPHIEQQITAGRLPAAWFAPPRDVALGVQSIPVVIPGA